MPDTICALTPLKRWNADQEFTIAPGLTISRLADGGFDPSDWKSYLSRPEFCEVEGHRYWISYATEGRSGADSQAEDFDAVRVLADAIMATQILNPGGCLNVDFVTTIFDGRWQTRTFNRGPRLNEPVWARMAHVKETDLADLPDIYSGVSRATIHGPTRLVNPIRLLQHGLQATEPLIRVLLFTAGLDMLLMAGETKQFVERLNYFLGPDTFVFPWGKYVETRPKYRVSDVAEDVYQLRNLIAHGQETHPRFLVGTGFLADGGGFALEPKNISRYRDVLCECAAFLLCGAIRKTLTTQGFIAAISDPTKWRKIVKP